MNKNLLSAILLIFLCNILMAQAPMYNFTLAKKLQDESVQNKTINLLIRGDVNQVREKCSSIGANFKYAAGDIVTVSCKVQDVVHFASLSSVTRIEANDLKLQPLNDQMIIKNHGIEVQNGFNLPQGYDGTDVVMGIIDEGIDFTHPDFRTLSGQTRIKYLWDQSLPDDATYSPQPYNYGFEYTSAMIDTSIRHKDYGSHGTHVTGIACGNGLAVNNYRGMAPNADIIVVKMDLNVPDQAFLTSFVDAVNYVFTKAQAIGKPAVINASLGTYFGSHDGKDIQAQAIDNIISTAPGRALVCAGGNAGSAPIHLGYSAITDTSMTWLQIPQYSGQNVSTYIEFWGDTLDFENIQFAVGVDQVKPAYTYKGGQPFSNVMAHLGQVMVDTIYNANLQRLGYILSYGDYNPLNQSFSMQYQIVADSIRNISGTDTSLYYWRIMTKGSGSLDAWSFDMVFDNLPDSNDFPLIRNYRVPDVQQTIVSSFSCSDKTITVGAYTNRNYFTNVNFQVVSFPTLVPGQIASLSSHGPTRDGRFKPDLAATGELVLSSGVQTLLNSLAATEPNKVAAGRKHLRSSGTSMASPAVAGAVALYFQRYPTATWQDVKTALLNCAERDQFTGTALPDVTWGYGKLNAYGLVKGCNTGLDEYPLQHSLNVYPNPASSDAVITVDLTAAQIKDASITIFDLAGKEIKRMSVAQHYGDLIIPVQNFDAGIYTVQLHVGALSSPPQRLVVVH